MFVEILMEIHIVVVDILLKTKHFNLMWAFEQTVTKDRRKHHRVWTKVINTAMVV